MNILVLFDVEGVIGVYTLKYMKYVKNLVNKECKLLLNKLKEIPGCNIFFCDCHNMGEYTVDIRERFGDVHFIDRVWNIDFDIGFDYVVMSGFHPMNGIRGILSHTFRKDINRVFIGNKGCGEVELFLNLVSYYNVKPLFISGCDMTLKEVENIKCIKHCSKVGLFENNIDKYYISYKNKLDEVIHMLNESKDIGDKMSYNNSKIVLKFVRNEICKEFGEDGTDVIEYENTIEFIKQLPEICKRLNLYWDKINSLLYLLKEKINADNEECSENIKDSCLLEKRISELTLEDLKSLLLN